MATRLKKGSQSLSVQGFDHLFITHTGLTSRKMKGLCKKTSVHVHLLNRHKDLLNLITQSKLMNFDLIPGQPGKNDYLLLTTSFTHNDIFYKAALAETISWEGLTTGTYDVLLQSGRGTKRLTLVKDNGGWRAGEEIEQVGVIQQEVVDLLGKVISEATAKV